ncbi:MAG: AraC family transcriptional regulator [Christensenellaceae bacterium]|jgi:AraC-like DNA-binding protein|nr:AraC family transcriptional regulator [Christensenellaceae bacterium]
MAYLIYIGKQPKTKLVPMHNHVDWEIICCTHGSGEMLFQNEVSIHYERGDVLVIPPNVLHMNASDDGFKNIYMRIGQWSTLHCKAFKMPDHGGFLRALAKRLLLTTASDIKYRTAITQNCVDLLLNLIIAGCDTDHHSKYVDILRDKLIENFADENFSIQDCVKDMPLSPEYLRKLFTKELGISPGKFLLRTRLQCAERLLKAYDTNKPKLEDVAHMCGFKDSLYFSRMFKKSFGVPPRVRLNELKSQTTQTPN